MKHCLLLCLVLLGFLSRGVHAEGELTLYATFLVDYTTGTVSILAEFQEYPCADLNIEWPPEAMPEKMISKDGQCLVILESLAGLKPFKDKKSGYWIDLPRIILPEGSRVEFLVLNSDVLTEADMPADELESGITPTNDSPPNDVSTQPTDIDAAPEVTAAPEVEAAATETAQSDVISDAAATSPGSGETESTETPFKFPTRINGRLLAWQYRDNVARGLRIPVRPWKAMIDVRITPLVMTNLSERVSADVLITGKMTLRGIFDSGMYYALVGRSPVDSAPTAAEVVQSILDYPPLNPSGAYSGLVEYRDQHYENTLRYATRFSAVISRHGIPTEDPQPGEYEVVLEFTGLQRLIDVKVMKFCDHEMLNIPSDVLNGDRFKLVHLCLHLNPSDTLKLTIADSLISYTSLPPNIYEGDSTIIYNGGGHFPLLAAIAPQAALYIQQIPFELRSQVQTLETDFDLVKVPAPMPPEQNIFNTTGSVLLYSCAFSMFFLVGVIIIPLKVIPWFVLTLIPILLSWPVQGYKQIRFRLGRRRTLSRGSTRGISSGYRRVRAKIFEGRDQKLEIWHLRLLLSNTIQLIYMCLVGVFLLYSLPSPVSLSLLCIVIFIDCVDTCWEWLLMFLVIFLVGIENAMTSVNGLEPGQFFGTQTPLILLILLGVGLLWYAPLYGRKGPVDHHVAKLPVFAAFLLPVATYDVLNHSLLSLAVIIAGITYFRRFAFKVDAKVPKEDQSTPLVVRVPPATSSSAEDQKPSLFKRLLNKLKAVLKGGTNVFVSVWHGARKTRVGVEFSRLYNGLSSWLDQRLLNKLKAVLKGGTNVFVSVWHGARKTGVGVEFSRLYINLCTWLDREFPLPLEKALVKEQGQDQGAHQGDEQTHRGESEQGMDNLHEVGNEQSDAEENWLQAVASEVSTVVQKLLKIDIGSETDTSVAPPAEISVDAKPPEPELDEKPAQTNSDQAQPDKDHWLYAFRTLRDAPGFILLLVGFSWLVLASSEAQSGTLFNVATLIASGLLFLLTYKSLPGNTGYWKAVWFSVPLIFIFLMGIGTIIVQAPLDTSIRSMIKDLFETNLNSLVLFINQWGGLLVSRLFFYLSIPLLIGLYLEYREGALKPVTNAADAAAPTSRFNLRGSAAYFVQNLPFFLSLITAVLTAFAPTLIPFVTNQPLFSSLTELLRQLSAAGPNAGSGGP